MWVFTTGGFLAIVQHKDLPDFFQVKSRSADPLAAMWPDEEIEEMITAADLDKDGYINEEEFLRILKKGVAT